MTNNHDNITARFERAVIQLRENLQHLADEGKVSDKFISMQNGIIKALIDYQRHTVEIIEELQCDNYELALKKSQEYQMLENIKESFEAICIIHGIMDFVSWMQMGKQYLVAEAVDYYSCDQVQIPFKLMELINELPEDQRDSVMSLLNKKGQERWRDELEALQIKLEKSQNAGT